MTLYEKNLNKYKISNIYTKLQHEIKDLTLEQELIKDKIVPVQDPNKVAIILVYLDPKDSDNYIESLLSKYPNYKEINLDINGKGLSISFPLKKESELLGKELENNKENNLVIKGSNTKDFLKRMALVDTLHELGYQVNIVDLTNNYVEKSSKKVEEYVEKIKKEGYSEDFLRRTENNKYISYLKLSNEKYKFNAQKENNILGFNIEYIYDENTPLEEVTTLNNKKYTL